HPHRLRSGIGGGEHCTSIVRVLNEITLSRGEEWVFPFSVFAVDGRADFPRYRRFFPPARHRLLRLACREGGADAALVIGLRGGFDDIDIWGAVVALRQPDDKPHAPVIICYRRDVVTDAGVGVES